MLLVLIACASRGPEVVESAEIGLVEQEGAIVGRDGGLSASLWGASVWTFGDTVLSTEDVLGKTWHHNSFSWTADTTASDGLSGFQTTTDAAGAPEHLLPPTDDELTFNLAHDVNDCAEEPCGARWAVWPGEPVWDAERSRALLPYGLIYAEPGEFNFHGVGQSIATWTVLEDGAVRPVLDAGAEHPDLIWQEGEPGWGVGSVIDGEHLYTFACDTDFLANPCALARAPLDDVQSRSAWRYFDGRGWSDDMSAAETLFDGAPIMSVAWSGHLQAWMTVYSPPFSEEILARTALDLTGPWSRPAVLHIADGEEPYDAVRHAEFDEDSGAVIYLSWSRSTGEGWFDTERPLVRVALQ